MAVRLILHVLVDDLISFHQASLQGVFLDRLGLSRHGAFVADNFVGFQEISVCGHFHSPCDFDHISHQNIVLMDLLLLSISNDCVHFTFFLFFVELDEFPLLLIIVDGRHSHTHEHGY